jgi:4-amino-4-deoxy-L-arabinose transferase-like glycosyltransferase
MRDYALSWDYHYHHYAGLFHLGRQVPSVDEPSEVPFTPPDPRLTVNDPFGPFTQIIPTLSQIIFSEKLKILPFDQAYNLPIIIIGSLATGLVFLFTYEMFGFLYALSSSLILSLYPIHFGYLHNNMKDIPNAFFYSLSIYLFWRLTKRKNLKNLIIAVLSFAIAFNVKINSIFIPLICFVWYVAINNDILNIFKFKPKKFFKDHKLIIFYFPLSVLAAIILWWPFWSEPLKKLLELPNFYSNNTINMPVLYWGKIIKSGVNIPIEYPYIILAISTPVVILLLFLIGLLIMVYKIIKREQSSDSYLLLIFWFIIPLLRYLNPKSGAIDGLRHFMEIIYPLIIISTIGFVFIYKKFANLKKAKLWQGLMISLMIIYLAFLNIIYHPYQTSYYSEIIGGIKGAWGKFDIDYWGTPQKSAMEWLNKNVNKDSNINIVMGQSTAALYLRDDLRRRVNSENYSKSDYLVILNRESFFYIYDVKGLLEKALQEKKIVYQKNVLNTPLVWVIKN